MFHDGSYYEPRQNVSISEKLSREKARARSAPWKKKLTPQQKAEYKAEKREEMQGIFMKIYECGNELFESEKYKTYLRYIMLTELIYNGDSSVAYKLGSYYFKGRDH